MDSSTSASFPEDPLEQVAQRTERAYIKIAVGTIAGLALFVAICWFVRFMYVHGQERRLLRQATNALQTRDYRTAGLAARSILQSTPRSIGAAKVLAQLAEQTGDRAAVDWRRNIAEAEGHASEDVLEWVRAALLFKDIGTARRALSKVDEAGRQTAGYNAVCALLAKADGDKERAILAGGRRCDSLPARRPINCSSALHRSTLRIQSNAPRANVCSSNSTTRPSIAPRRCATDCEMASSANPTPAS